MGIVYEATQVSLHRRVALKVLPFASTLDSRQLQRFKNEAQTAACLHHTNIVPVFATGVERGVHYYAMQFIEGNSLAEVIEGLTEEESKRRLRGLSPKKEEPPPSSSSIIREIRVSNPSTAIAELSTLRSTKPAEFYRTVAELGIQAAEALEYAHQMGIVHRDIKLGNLLLEADGATGRPVAPSPRPPLAPSLRLWITDFGLAQVQSESTRLTLSGDVLGTLRYMSPEQALGKLAIVDHRTDIYSLGVTLYELLTLHPAFDGKDRQEVLRQIAFEEPRAPRKINKHIPAENVWKKEPCRRMSFTSSPCPTPTVRFGGSAQARTATSGCRTSAAVRSTKSPRPAKSRRCQSATATRPMHSSSTRMETSGRWAGSTEACGSSTSRAR